jgi:hypothetical protein
LGGRRDETGGVTTTRAELNQAAELSSHRGPPHHLGAARVEICDQGVAVESLVGDQSAEFEILDQRRHSYGVEPVPGQQHEPDQVSERVGQGQDLGGHATL